MPGRIEAVVIDQKRIGRARDKGEFFGDEAMNCGRDGGAIERGGLALA
jgi:hypothetical protein